MFLQDVTVNKTDNYSFQYLWSIYLFYLIFYLVTIESKCSNIERGHPEREKLFVYINVYKKSILES